MSRTPLSRTQESQRVIDPATGEALGEYALHEPAEISRRLARARAAFELWRATPFAARARAMRAVAGRLRERRDTLADRMTAEMGKPIAQSEAEVEKCAWVCEHFADHAEAYLALDPIPTDARRSFTRCDPLGVVLAIMPWNFPLWQVFRCAAPALMAGNAVALKHASNVPGCAHAIESLFDDAEFPAGLFSALRVPSSSVGALIEHPAVEAVSLTGSEAAGREVAAHAGRALKKCVLELGGSDAFVVLDDADPEAVAAEAVAARVQNAGQSCIAAKRFIIVEPLADRFERSLMERMSRLRVGDPRDRATEVGPLARADLRETLHALVAASVTAGATLAVGGTTRPGRGWFYAPTVLLGVTPGMPAFDEETFGPVAAVTRARDEAEAIALANHSRFALGASVWTGDAARGERVAAAIEAGAVFVNGMVRSDPRLPFGGIKRSGWGRELAREGIREFVNLKTVWVR
jgi:succinate-semialdehyde dehydrogenase/glutarate-semialdehyde dehydrogenase